MTEGCETGSGFVSAAPALAAAIDRLRREEACALPLLAEDERQRLEVAAEALPFRPARPVVGEGERTVHQDFELCTSFRPDDLFHGLARRLEDAVAAALELLDPPPLGRRPRFNDLIVQRYAPGSAGITPHRDHVRYQGLVAIVTLAGAARFLVCADRAGMAAREVPAPAGSLLLLRAPAFDGRRERPFHFLTGVTRRRLSLGLRDDTRAGEPDPTAG